MSNKELSVGFVAKRCGIKVSTLHFYEQKSLIHSWRNKVINDVIKRVAIIKAAQKLGISLTDINIAFQT